MSPFPTSRRPLAPPSGAQPATTTHETSQRPAHPATPPRVDATPQRDPLSWGKILGFGIGGGLLIAGLAAAAMNLFW